MYRRQGSHGVLKGVLSGPYTGGAKRIDVEKLSPALRQRLVAVFVGNAKPQPILVNTPGRFLLPLDIVEVLPGSEVIVVTPLGDARDVFVRDRELVVVFANGTTSTFALSDDGVAESVMRRLEHSQRLLEDLSYGGDLGRAFADDPFFDLRVDASWAEVAPSSATRGPRRSNRVFAVATCAAIAIAGFAATHGWRDHTAEARVRVNEPAPPIPSGDPAAHPAAPADCLSALRDHAAPNHPDVSTMMAGLIAYAHEETDGVVPVRFKRRENGHPDGDDRGIDWDARERVVTWAFERVFSETCPASIVRFAIRDIDGPGLAIDYRVDWGAAQTSTARIVFDVTLRGANKEERTAFRLTMDPPKSEKTAVRDRSLFVVRGSTPAEQRDEAMTARAFDRLYDEIFSLFFAGDPRVPLREDEAEP